MTYVKRPLSIKLENLKEVGDFFDICHLLPLNQEQKSNSNRSMSPSKEKQVIQII